MISKVFLRGLWLCVLGYIGLFAATTPSNERDWTLDQSRLPIAQFTGSLVHIRNIRDFRYHGIDGFIPGWYDRTFDLERLVRVWFIVEPFSGWDGAAHTFLSFEFEPAEPGKTNAFLSISVEIRKEQGESYSPVMGLLRQYELMYVVADERDVIPLRALHRGHDVYVYPARMPSQPAMQALLTDMLQRANRLHEHPEYYNTLSNACTSNIVRHVNKLFPDFVPWSHKVIFPGYADELAYELGMIDTALPFEKIRDHFRVNARVRPPVDTDDFSKRIRPPMTPLP